MGKWEEEIRQLWFLDFIVLPDNEIFFSAGWFNGLIKVNLKEEKGEKIAHFPYERSLIGGLHKEILYDDNKLYFCPRHTNYLCIYDLKEGALSTYELPLNEQYWQTRENKFHKMVLDGKYLYLLPYNYNQILAFDIESKGFIIYDEWFNDYENKVGHQVQNYKYMGMFTNHIICENSYLWYIDDTDLFMVFNKKTGQVSYVDAPEQRIVSVEKSEKNQSLICKDGSCWSYNEKEKVFECKYILEINTNEILYEFAKEANTFYIPSKVSNELLIYNANTNVIEKVEFETDGKIYENSVGVKWKVAFVWIKEIGNQLWMLNKYNEIIRYNICDKTYIKNRFTLENEIPKIDWVDDEDPYSDKYTYYPYRSEGLVSFMHRVKKLKAASNNEIKSVGKQIFNSVKDI